MRWIFVLLLVINILFFGVMQLNRGHEPVPTHGHEPLRAEEIRLLPDPPKTPEPAKTPEPPKAPEPASALPNNPAEAAGAGAQQAACLEWGTFSGDDLKRAELALEKLQLGDKLARYQTGKPGGYWVYIAPRKTLQEAQKKVAELKKQGVKESFIIRAASKWQYAISLGIFSGEDAAVKFVDQLHRKGVKSAVAGPRDPETEVVIFQVKGADAGATAALTSLKTDFPSGELKTVECRKPEEVQ